MNRNGNKSGRAYLDLTAVELLADVFITSHFNMAKVLLYGVCNTQLIQNMSARTVEVKRKYDHITPVLYNLLSALASHPVHDSV